MVPIDVNGNGQADPDEIYDTKDQAVNAVATGRYPSPPARDLNLVTRGKPAGLGESVPRLDPDRWSRLRGRGGLRRAAAGQAGRRVGETGLDDAGLQRKAWLLIVRSRQRGKGSGRLSQGLSRRRKDRLSQRLMGLLTLSAVLLVPLIALALFLRARPILAAKPLGELLLSTTWHPLKGEFGFYPFIMGTLWVTAVAMVIAVPPSLLTAIYLAEYAPARFRALAKPLIDLLAGIPSVVYGVWGVLTVVPFVEHTVAPALNRWLGVLAPVPHRQPHRLRRVGRRAGAGGDGLSHHHRRGRRGDPGRAPGLARGVAGPGRHPLADDPERGAAAGLAGGDGRRGAGPLPRLWRDHGRADGGRQRGPGAPLHL